MDMRIWQRGWRYENRRMNLKCVCIYCMYRCVRGEVSIFCLFVSVPNVYKRTPRTKTGVGGDVVFDPATLQDGGGRTSIPFSLMI
ncbi:hypothetical protein Hanom_Chr00s000330g01637561 [Helianthus anomalus]